MNSLKTQIIVVSDSSNYEPQTMIADRDGNGWYAQPLMLLVLMLLVLILLILVLLVLIR